MKLANDDRELQLSDDHANACQIDTDVSNGNSDDRTIQVSVATEQPPKRIGPYAIERQIGCGAMGTVYQATHTVLKRKVALKVLPAGLNMLPDRLSRFQREMEAVGRLDHPNVVRANDAGQFEGVHFLAMELIEGKDLSQIIQSRGPLSCEHACELIRQTAIGLQHVFECNLVHRDIKPSNLFLTTDGVVKILDLGIARLRHSEAGTATVAGATMGTANFIAPEQITGAHEVDIRADIYSLGCTLYMLLCGRPPFHGPEFETEVAKLIAHGEVAPIPLSNQFSSEIRQIVNRMIEKDPEDRFQTPLEVIDAVTALSDSAGLRELVDANCDPVEPRSNANTLQNSKSWKRKKQAKSKAVWIAAAVAIAAMFGVASEFSKSDDSAQKDAMLKSLKKVASSSDQISHDTRLISASGKKIEENTHRMADSIDQLRTAFNGVIGQGELVANPKSNREYYHNARIFEHRGNYASARKNYEIVIKSGAEFVDVHYNFQKLVRIHEGAAGANAVYAALSKDLTNAMRNFCFAMLDQQPHGRIDRLQEALDASPDFAMAHYEFSRCFSRATLGEQTIQEKKSELRHLEQFLESAASHGLDSFFLDPAESETYVTDARERLTLLQSHDASTFDNPVKVTFSPAPLSGWNALLDIVEPANKILYRLGPKEEFHSTGSLPIRDPKTGLPAPVKTVSLPSLTDGVVLEVEYFDIRGVLQGPYSFPFDSTSVKLDDAKLKLNLTKSAWVKFSKDSNKISLARLAYYRDSIAEVRFGFDGEEATRQFDLPALGSRSSNKSVFLTVPEEINQISISVVLNNGEELSSQFQRL